ncbi:MAG TPA: DNA-formamidopyrimidine glycosylase family protein [Mycobacteriales bacterium]
MPEGDTVHRAAQRLAAALLDQRLTHADLRVPDLATVDLVGRTVTAVIARGKHLLTRLDDDLTLHTHFRMDGAFRLFRPGTPWRGGPAHQIRVVLGNAGWTAVGYRIPVVELLPTSGESRVVGHLGPDVLGPDWDPDAAVARIRSQPHREIGTALLDQRNLCGLGNVYRTEALYLAGVHPRTPVADVTDLPGLVIRAQRLVAAHRDRATRSTTGTLRGERYHVYGRGGRPCGRCGCAIRTSEQGDPGQARTVAWCPGCQPSESGAGAEQRGDLGRP